MRANKLALARRPRVHIVVGEQDTADVVVSDSDCAPGESRPTVTLGGADLDVPGVLSREASVSQIDGRRFESCLDRQ